MKSSVIGLPGKSPESLVATMVFPSRSATAAGSTAWWYFSVVSRRQAAMSVRPALVRPSSLTVASEAKHSASAWASCALWEDMKSSIAFGKCTDMVIPLRSAPSLLPVWPQDGDRLGKWQERTTNFAGQTDLPAMANQIRAFGLRQIDPTGKSLLIFRNRVKPRNQKYFASPPTQIRCISPTSCPTEGRCARHETRVRDAVDAASSGEQ